MAAKLKKGDNVVVLVGKDIGRTGEILSVNPKKGKAVVKEVNLAIRHMRQTQNAKRRKTGKGDADRPVQSRLRRSGGRHTHTGRISNRGRPKGQVCEKIGKEDRWLNQFPA